MRSKRRQLQYVSTGITDVPLVEFKYRVFTRMPGELP